jgi:hypothetical protein
MATGAIAFNDNAAEFLSATGVAVASEPAPAPQADSHATAALTLTKTLTVARNFSKAVLLRCNWRRS